MYLFSGKNGKKSFFPSESYITTSLLTGLALERKNLLFFTCRMSNAAAILFIHKMRLFLCNRRFKGSFNRYSRYNQDHLQNDTTMDLKKILTDTKVICLHCFH